MSHVHEKGLKTRDQIVSSGIGLFRKLSLGSLVAILIAGAINYIYCGNGNAYRSDYCIQPDPVAPDGKFEHVSKLLAEGYRGYSAQVLSGAVQIPTTVYSSMTEDPKEDLRFGTFSDLHAYLAASFPLSLSSLELVQSYGLICTVKGRSPGHITVLLVHQGVPVLRSDLASDWDHEPFSGLFDGERIWGSGAGGAKNALIASLEAVEALLAQGWVPDYDVVLGLGFDIELGGARGAAHLAELVQDRYGSVDLIIDSNGEGIANQFGSTYGLVGIAEKGLVELEIAVHAGSPPDKTTLRLANQIVEDTEKYPIVEIAPREACSLSQEIIACHVAHRPDLSRAARARLLSDVDVSWDAAANAELDRIQGLVREIAVDSSGVKIHAGIRKAELVQRSSIGPGHTPKLVRDRLVSTVKRLFRRQDLGMIVDDEVLIAPLNDGHVDIRTSKVIHASPISPHTATSESWRLIAGTTKHVLETHFGLSRVVVVPAILDWPTDAAHFSQLTANVYRYRVGLPGGSANLGTANEWTTIDSHLAAVAWYYEMLQFR